MSFNNFIPEIWSKVILEALRKKLVYASPFAVNDDYEGEIQGPGNTVHITQIGDPTISDYSRDSTSLSYESPSDAGLQLLIDQAKYFAFKVGDVDRRQAAGDIQRYLEGRAAYRLADAADQFVASKYTESGSVLGSTGSPLTPGVYSSSAPADFYLKVMLPAKVLLDEANVPDDDRVAVLPPWAVSLLEQTSFVVQFGDSAGAPGIAMQRGFMGFKVAGFTIFKSNNTPNPTGSVYACQFSHPMAVTYGEQIAETEALRLQSDFADGVRGLHVYGAKVVRPEALGIAYVTRPSGV